MGNEIVTSPAGWIAFLRARVDEEKRLAHVAAADGWWDTTEPGARRFGIEADGRLLASVLTGRGVQADTEVARYILSHQPQRALEDLDAKEQLLEHCERLGEAIPPQLLAVLRQFAEPFHDHPDHPVHTPAAS
ncbi:hypothetical protein EF903_06845 [Streptomyces sp. WAC05292]|uniref:DUF6221 family protein n=1 Tax=Streptomyces sp. WAC05292 TaxID=2487418 RepID=UPI000F738D6B|nr:DUF6221 family protein [Streptomyces sp. WAC05292]RSS94249.1 hypothetical protein EF903_06845 [Streptomyces sp. WAC05292]